jgi:hypothetical protein
MVAAKHVVIGAADRMLRMLAILRVIQLRVVTRALHWLSIVAAEGHSLCLAQGEADSSLDHLWQKKKAELNQ